MLLAASYLVLVACLVCNSCQCSKRHLRARAGEQQVAHSANCTMIEGKAAAAAGAR